MLKPCQSLAGQKFTKTVLATAISAALAACGGAPVNPGPGTGSSSTGNQQSSTGNQQSSSGNQQSSSGNQNSSSGSNSSNPNVDRTPFTRKDNVFEEVDNWYVNEWWAENAIRDGGAEIAVHNTGVWMDRIGAIEDIPAGLIPNVPGLEDGQGPNEGFGLRQHLEAAEAQGNALFHFVSYNLPGRDCAAVASNGELPASEYGMEVYTEHYVDRIYNVLADFPHIPVVAVIEIDSLPNLVTNSKDEPCQEVNNSTSYGYTNGVRYSINKYSQLDNVHIYVDAGHSGWLGWDDDLRLGSLFMHGVITGFDGMESQAASIGQEIEAAEGSTGKYENIGPTFQEPPNFTSNGVASNLTDPPGYDKIAGFITNTSNYTPIEEPFIGDPREPEGANPLRSHYFYDWNPRVDEWTFTEDWLDALREHGSVPNTIGMIIDTGRNGWGQNRQQNKATATGPDQVMDSKIDGRLHRGNWCNQPGGVGARPQANPDGKTWIDAYVWTKPQGEADGIAYGEDDPRWVVDDDDKNKKHDPMCDPEALSTYGQNATSTADLNLKTGALPDSPHAGRWFSEAFQLLVENAYPPICQGEGDDC